MADEDERDERDDDPEEEMRAIVEERRTLMQQTAVGGAVGLVLARVAQSLQSLPVAVLAAAGVGYLGWRHYQGVRELRARLDALGARDEQLDIAAETTESGVKACLILALVFGAMAVFLFVLFKFL